MKAYSNIEETMTEYPCVVGPKTTVIQAMDLMQKNHLRHLPVVRDGQVVGVLSERDLKQAEILSDSMTMIVSDVMTPDPFCVPVGTALSEVAKTMAQRKLGCAVIVNGVGSVVGIFTTTDAMHVLSNVLSGQDHKKAASAPVESYLLDLLKFKIF
jgi:acetoin utilization protein AcuB